MTNIVPKTCFEGPLGDVLRTSWGRPESTSQGRPVDVGLGRPLGVILGRPQDVRSGRLRDGQIGSLRYVLWRLEGDVLGTSWGTVFAGWVGSCNTLNDLSNQVCIPNKTEDLNLSKSNLITGIN